ncbi:MAG: bifunctional phosphopantothenoylcysteine decarboxylase/phosphopantothenate--cysteine ligase CoaBC [Anaerolineales bacterium]
MPLSGKRILLGVTGSIACYKAVELASALTQLGAEVDTVLTSSARKFISPLAFQSLTGRPAFTDDDLWGPQGHVLHVQLGKEAHLIAVAPATANTLAKMAQGFADNLLTLSILAASVKILVAPAMDGGMYEHPSTQATLKILAERDVEIVGPVEGHLASGLKGLGRMVEPQELAGHVRLLTSREGALSGRRILVTAGGTQEAIDPVRVITNRSSGKQGYALAQEALDMGASVTLISGPTALPAPVGAKVVNVTSAKEMLDAVLAELPGIDALLMAAAVGDFQPVLSSAQKIKRADKPLVVELRENPDILLNIASHSAKPRVVVGFAAESEELLKNAEGKLRAKNLDLIVANDISKQNSGFEVDTNKVVILDKAGGKQESPLISKTEVAKIVLDRVVALLR